MKAGLPLLVAGLGLVMTNTAHAKTTKLTFPKGSYCTQFTGDDRGRTFTLYLKQGQYLSADLEDDDRRLIATDPNGRRLKYAISDTDYGWDIPKTGTYRIKVLGGRENYNEIKFCAY